MELIFFNFQATSCYTILYHRVNRPLIYEKFYTTKHDVLPLVYLPHHSSGRSNYFVNIEVLRELRDLSFHPNRHYCRPFVLLYLELKKWKNRKTLHIYEESKKDWLSRGSNIQSGALQLGIFKSAINILHYSLFRIFQHKALNFGLYKKWIRFVF